MKHEKTPWKFWKENEGKCNISSGDFRVAITANETNARRIVACVNACEGFSTEELESANNIVAWSILERDRLREQNAELVAIFKKHESRIRYAHEIYSEFTIYGEDLEEILTALAKYEESLASQ